jgi:hypothetical protein
MIQAQTTYQRNYQKTLMIHQFIVDQLKNEDKIKMRKMK